MRAAFAALFAAQQRRELDVFQRVQGRDQHKRLKDKTDMPRAQRGSRLFIKQVQRLPDQVDFAAAAVVQTGQNRQQRRLAGTGFANQRDGFGAFDNEFNSGKD